MKTIVKHIEDEFQTLIQERANGNLLIITGPVGDPKEMVAEYSGLSDHGKIHAIQNHLAGLVFDVVFSESVKDLVDKARAVYGHGPIFDFDKA